MAEAPDADSEQGWVSATFQSGYPAGIVVQVVQSSTVIASWTAEKTFASVVLSSGAVTTGETYEIWGDGTPSGDAAAGLTLGGRPTAAPCWARSPPASTPAARAAPAAAGPDRRRRRGGGHASSVPEDSHPHRTETDPLREWPANGPGSL
jgi:hypothetical protein